MERKLMDLIKGDEKVHNILLVSFALRRGDWGRLTDTRTKAENAKVNSIIT